jgi:hypothetical protein
MIIKKVKPLFTSVVTTMDKYEDDVIVNGLVNQTAGTLKEYQTVVAIGSSVRDIKVGDVVSINPSRYAVKKYEDGSMHDGVISQNPVMSYSFHTIDIDGVEHLLLQDRDIDFVIEEYELPQQSDIVTDVKPMIVS